MQLIAENLVIITRPGIESGHEVLIGRKKRGRFAGYDTFPGGRLEGAAPQASEASRELYEETGLDLDPGALRYCGRLVVFDKKPGSERFGNITLFAGRVAAGTEAKITDELETRWEPIDSPGVTVRMPPDAEVWWPIVRNAQERTIITHVQYDEAGNLDVIAKEPDFHNQFGQILAERHVSV